jgi:hypothetical protein
MKSKSQTSTPWKSSSQIALMRRTAADGGPKLRVPIELQYRIGKSGKVVYRWKEKYDRNEGDSSETFSDRESCVVDGAKYAAEHSN